MNKARPRALYSENILLAFTGTRTQTYAAIMTLVSDHVHQLCKIQVCLEGFLFAVRYYLSLSVKFEREVETKVSYYDHLTVAKRNSWRAESLLSRPNINS